MIRTATPGPVRLRRTGPGVARENGMGFFDGCPGSKNIKDPFPEIIKCKCGKEIEIWSDEVETVCPHCKKKVNRDMPQSCLDWCSMAKECIGPEKYKKYKQSKDKGL